MEINELKCDKSGYLDVKQARLYYETKGEGPAIVLIPGANGNAPIFAPIREFLCKNFKVITYDRRGFTRSKLSEDYQFTDKLADDANDVAALIDSLSDDGTAFVMGSSSGAIVALKTLLLHADKIKMLIPHEPPAIELFANDKEKWEKVFKDVLVTYRTEGIKAAMQQFADGNVPPKDAQAMQHKDLAPDSQTTKDTRYWFEHELPIYPYTKWTVNDFAPCRNKLLPANGTESAGYFPTFANLNLHRELGVDILSVPGGHLGYLFEAEEFARILTKALLK